VARRNILSTHPIAPRQARLETTDRKVLQSLLDGHDVEIDWQAEEIKIPISRIRDGSLVKDEIFRLCNEHCHYAYETRDGKLRVTDTASQTIGADIILGVNILSFNAEQSEDKANSEVTVKGHRNGDAWGRDAVIPTVTTMEDSWVGTNIPLVIQHYGDASPEALERRGKFEVDKRATESKRVTIETFGLGQDGEPWDIGNTHYVEIPVEGIFDVMECVELTYTIETEQLTTSLVMAPAPSGAIRGSGASSLLSGQNAISDAMRRGEARRAETGIQIVPGQYPSSWTSAAISLIQNPITTIAAAINSLIQSPQDRRTAPPMILTEDDN
jgi:Mu-like prophage tail protein gpP